MGDWLDKYGEAIYATRPWYTFGEGPTKEPIGHFKNHREFAKVKYTNQDVRYTTKGDSIYAIVLGSPEPNQLITLTAFAKSKLPKDTQFTKVIALGSDESITWTQTDAGLKIVAPASHIESMATVFKIN